MKPWNYVLVAATAILACALSWSSAGAFDLTGAGGRFGTLDAEGRDMTPAVGAHLEFESAGSRFHVQPGFLYWSKDQLSDVNPNMDVYYHFAPPGHVSPYVGAGAGLHFYNTDGPGDPGTDAGMNVLGGILLPSRGASFFIEGRYAVTERAQTSFLAGLTARFGH